MGGQPGQVRTQKENCKEELGCPKIKFHDVGTFEGDHKLEIILYTSPVKVGHATYTILFQPMFLPYCVYAHSPKKVENDVS